jgi:hypothetical protein
MHKFKTLWRSVWSARVCEELETWTQVLLALGAVVLLFVTLKTQAAQAAATLEAAETHRETIMAAGTYTTTCHGNVPAALARRMPPAPRWFGSSS